MFTIALSAISLALAGSTPADPAAAPQPTVAAAPVTTAKAAPSDSARYCVKDTITGSMLDKRVCKTRSQWLATGFDPLARK